MTQAESARRFYDRISGVYDTLADASEHAVREAGLRLLAPAGQERLLEIGFGTGQALVAIAGQLSGKGRVSGIDVSSGMLSVAARRVREHGVADRVDLVLGDAKRLPYADGAFDGAFASFTLELFAAADIGPVLSEIARVLRPSGRLGVVSMLDDGRGGTVVELYRFLHRHFPHIVDCQPIDVPGQLTRAGFAVGERDVRSIWGLPVMAVVAHRRDPARSSPGTGEPPSPPAGVS